MWEPVSQCSLSWPPGSSSSLRAGVQWFFSHLSAGFEGHNVLTHFLPVRLSFCHPASSSLASAGLCSIRLLSKLLCDQVRKELLLEEAGHATGQTPQGQVAQDTTGTRLIYIIVYDHWCEKYKSSNTTSVQELKVFYGGTWSFCTCSRIAVISFPTLNTYTYTHTHTPTPLLSWMRGKGVRYKKTFAKETKAGCAFRANKA